MNKVELLTTIKDLMNRTDELPDSERIKLRRCCGHTLDEVTATALMIYYRILQKTSMKSVYGSDKAIFPAVCIRCLWSKEENSSSRIITVAAAAHELAKKENSPDRLQKRLVRILDDLHTEDGLVTKGLYRLIHEIRIKEPGLVIDTTQLALDLYYWNNSDRFVQKRWIQEFCTDNDMKEE